MRRLAFLGMLVLVMVPFIIAAPVTLLCAGGYWLATGRDVDHILLNRPLGWLVGASVQVLGR